MESNPQILVVSSELENRRALNAILCQEGYNTICASRVSECKEALQTQNVSLIFCDRRLSDGNYRDVVAAMRESRYHARVIVTSRLADWDEYLDALHHGAFDLIASPCQPTDDSCAHCEAQDAGCGRAPRGWQAAPLLGLPPHQASVVLANPPDAPSRSRKSRGFRGAYDPTGMAGRRCRTACRRKGRAMKSAPAIEARSRRLM